MTLTVTINYQGQSTPATSTVSVGNLDSATDPMPAVATPGNVVGTFQVTVDGQDGTGQSYEQGFVHLVVTAPGGVVFQQRDVQPGALAAQRPGRDRLGQHQRQPGTRPHLRDSAGEYH